MIWPNKSLGHSKIHFLSLSILIQNWLEVNTKEENVTHLYFFLSMNWAEVFESRCMHSFSSVRTKNLPEMSHHQRKIFIRSLKENNPVPTLTFEKNETSLPPALFTFICPIGWIHIASSFPFCSDSCILTRYLVIGLGNLNACL